MFHYCSIDYEKYVVFLIRKNKNLDKQEVFSALKKLRQIYRNRLFVIVPTTEFLNRFCLEYRDEFEKNQCIIPLVERELYEQFSDKEAFWNLCKSAHLDVPEKIEISEKFTKPYVAKPKRYAAKDGKIYSPVIVLSGDDYYAEACLKMEQKRKWRSIWSRGRKDIGRLRIRESQLCVTMKYFMRIGTNKIMSG